jgi:hypothetical protein
MEKQSAPHSLFWKNDFFFFGRINPARIMLYITSLILLKIYKVGGFFSYY